MQIHVVTAGKVKQAWLREGIAEYSKRIQPYMDLDIVEVADASDQEIPGRAVEQESERLWAKVKPGSFVVALDLAGQQMDSVSFAENLEKWLELGGSQIYVLIGGSLGFSRSLLEKCQVRFSMGPMTFPHQLARLVFLEQVYRACKINHHEKYHK